MVCDHPLVVTPMCQPKSSSNTVIVIACGAVLTATVAPAVAAVLAVAQTLLLAALTAALTLIAVIAGAAAVQVRPARHKTAVAALEPEPEQRRPAELPSGVAGLIGPGQPALTIPTRQQETTARV